jgi:glycosyltransferase involved in cell wall biosynthesis
MTDEKISFIIPAYNEAARIHRTIDAIKNQIADSYDYEVIVVDHGSKDDTREIANMASATVLSHPQGTIAGLRNNGANYATGDILVFVDADVLLTVKWANRFKEVAPMLLSGKRVLTGSWVSVPENSTWIERNWFKPLQKGENSHINSGHLIIARALFVEIGGFDENLETGEDYEISMRAKSRGLDVIDDVQLEAVHEGYPQSIKAFFYREYWHGKGDSQSLASLMSSKVAIFSVIFICLHLLFLFGCIAGFRSVELTTIILILIALLFMVTMLKYKNEAVQVIVTNMFLYYVYMWARSFSLINLLTSTQPVKRMR